MIDLKTLTDDALATLLDDARAEYQRRQTLQTALQEEPALQAAYLDSVGRGMGEPYVPPTGAHDAYPLGWKVMHNGKTWESLVPSNVWEPGMSGWREVVEEGGVPMWVQPTGAHDAYKAGDVTAHKGSIWISDINGNVWEPGVYGWTLEDPQDT